MSYRRIGDEISEEYYLPKGMYITVDYGIVIPDTGEYECMFSRYMGTYRRSQLKTNSDEIITEVVEKNPDYAEYENQENISDENYRWGDEFERIIKFNNGYIAKIEYWKSLNERDQSFGRYDAKYRKIILLNETDVLFEFMEDNPYYIDPHIESVVFSVEDLMQVR